MAKPVENWGKTLQWNPNHKKAVLADVVPLDTPFLVYIDPTNACNFRCSFCPTGHPDLLNQVGRTVKTMSMETFRKVLDDLAEFPRKFRCMFFHKDGEPLLNPRLGEMMKMAVDRSLSEKYWLTTNASMLTAQRARDIVASGIDYVRLSIEHVDSEGYKALTQTWSDYDALLENVAMLHEERNRQGSPLQIVAKVINFNFTDEQLEKFRADFGPITDQTVLTEPNGWTSPDVFDFALGIQPKAGYDGEMPLHPNRIACHNPFYNLVINSNGSVGLCPLDWSHSLVVDHVRSRSLVEIWNGRKARALQVQQLAGRRHENFACKNCQCLPYAAETELDPKREVLLEKFRQLEQDAR